MLSLQQGGPSGSPVPPKAPSLRRRVTIIQSITEWDTLAAACRNGRIWGLYLRSQAPLYTPRTFGCFLQAWGRSLSVPCVIVSGVSGRRPRRTVRYEGIVRYSLSYQGKYTVSKVQNSQDTKENISKRSFDFLIWNLLWYGKTTCMSPSLNITERCKCRL